MNNMFDANEEHSMQELRDEVKRNPNQGSILIKVFLLGKNREAELRYYPVTQEADFEYVEKDEQTDDYETMELFDIFEDFRLDMSNEEMVKKANQFLKEIDVDMIFDN